MLNACISGLGVGVGNTCMYMYMHIHVCTYMCTACIYLVVYLIIVLIFRDLIMHERKPLLEQNTILLKLLILRIVEVRALKVGKVKSFYLLKK